MKKRRNRMAFDGTKDESFQWYWLANKVEDFASRFASVDAGGNADYYNASNSIGIRPTFKIKNH